MHRSRRTSFSDRSPIAGGQPVVRRAAVVSALVAAAAASFALGCRGEGVGDPCLPENIPNSGFDPTEAYLETSSVQCRTRTCMVYQLDGHPERILNTPSCPADQTSTCVQDESVVAERVFCSCRCAGGGSNTPLCECPDGFACEEVVSTGGGGVRGSYCVRCDSSRSDLPDC